MPITDIGIHGAIQGNTVTNIAVANALNANTFLWIAGNHQPADAAMWPVATHIVRLLNPQPGEAASHYVDRVFADADRWLSAEIADLYFIIGNEPDVQGYDLRTPWEIADWKHDAPFYLAEMRDRLVDAFILSTPFSGGNIHETDDDYAAPFDGVALHYYTPASDFKLPAINVTPARFPIYWTELNINPTTLDQLATILFNIEGVGACIFIPDAQGTDWPFYDFTEQNARDLVALMAGPPIPAPEPVPEPPQPTPTPPQPDPTPQPPSTAYSENSSLLGDLSAVPERWIAKIAMTNADDARTIVNAYQSCCHIAGINADLALAQAYDETGGFTSPAWLQRRNAAGIGITSNAVLGVNFRSIIRGVKAHIALLCCFAMAASPAEVDAWGVLEEFGYGGFHRNRSRLGSLDGVWAVPGVGYGASIAAIANEVVDRAQPAPVPTPATGPTLADILTEARTFIGWKYTEEGVAEFGACEMWVEELLVHLGVFRYRWPTAADHCDWLLENNLIRTEFPPPPGAILVFNRRFDPNGHICEAAEFPMVITTYPGQISEIDGTGWYISVGYVGWYIPDGISEDGGDMVLPSDGTLDWGLMQQTWTALGAVWNPNSGILHAWIDAFRRGVYYGVPVGKEQAFDGGARIEQPFSSGVTAQYTSGDDTVRWLATLPAGYPS